MLEYMNLYYTKDRKTILTPEWNQFVNSIYLHSEEIRNTYLKNANRGYMSPGRSMLLKLLRIADIPSLARMNDNYYICSTQMDDIIRDCKNVIMDSRMGQSFRGMFMTPNPQLERGGEHNNELFIMTDDNNPYSYLPLDCKDIDRWNEQVSPLVLWDYDPGYEQTFDVLTKGQLRFKQTAPAKSLWLIDMYGFILKAVQYYRVYRDNNHVNYLNSIFGDVIKWSLFIWLKKILDGLTYEDMTYDTLTNKGRLITNYTYISVRYKQAFDEIRDIYSSIRKGTVRPSTFLQLPLFMVPNKGMQSFATFVSSWEEMYNLSHSGKYDYWLTVRDIPWITHMCLIYNLVEGTYELRRKFMLEIRRLRDRWKQRIAGEAHMKRLPARYYINDLDHVLSFSPING